MVQRKPTKLTIGSFDLLKGVAIVLMILSHTIGRYDLQRSSLLSGLLNILGYIGPVSIPAFFVISGMGFREKSHAAMLKKTFKDTMIPYLLVTASYAVLFPLVRYPFSGSWSEVFTYAIRYVAAFLLGNIQYGRIVYGYEVYWCTAMWFFLALFIALNILNCIVKIKRLGVQIICVVFLALLGVYMGAKDYYLFSVYNGLQAVGYCYIGYVIQKYKLFDYLRKNVLTYVFGVSMLLLQTKILQWDQLLLITQCVYYVAMCACLPMVIVVGARLGNEDLAGTSWIKTIGMYSYWIVCIHSFETEAFPWYMMSQSLQSRPLFAFCLEAVIKTAFIVYICKAIKKIANWRYRRKMRSYGKQKAS